MRRSGIFLAAAAAILLAGCRRDMQDQPRYETFERSDFFPDRLSSRPQVPNTVAQGQLYEDELLYTGKVNGQLATVFPFPVTREVIERGRDRFDIFCTPCHSRLGDGEGMIVQRGFRKPPSYHIPRLREAPVGHFFDVITNGFGAMTDYAARVEPRDRWAIIAYIRALQLSQNATVNEVPADQRGRLETAHETGGEHTEAGREGTPAATPGGPDYQGPRQPQPSGVVPGNQGGPRK